MTMEPSLPIAPLFGMSQGAYLALALLLGTSFGFFLERAGFGSARNLTSIFVLRDFRVFRVLFSAVITGMLGLQLLRATGVMDASLLEYDPTFFWAMLAGGVVFGVGFYVGGFCPGTAVVAVVRGRWDGLAFLFGIAAGMYGFALMFDAVETDPSFMRFFSPPSASRRLIHGDGPSWPWVLGLTAIALVAFRIVPLVERRFALRTVEQQRAARDGLPVPPPAPPVLRGRILKVGPALAVAVAVAVMVADLVGPRPAASLAAAPARVAVAVDAVAVPTVDPLSLAGWVVTQAHRRAAGEPPNAWVLDLRPEAERQALSIPGALAAEPTGRGDGRLVPLLDLLAKEMTTPALRSAPLVLVDRDDAEATRGMVADLRARGFDAMLLLGGWAAWERGVLASESDWPSLALREAPVEVEAGTDAVVAGEQGEQGAPPVAIESPLVDLPAAYARVRSWLAGRTTDLPPRLAIPGTVRLPSRAATVTAKGGHGGGCG